MTTQGTRIGAVMADVQAKIAARIYPPGSRLPSLRAQASAMKVSISTVVEAYERLAAEKVIASHPGSGFFVIGPAAPLTLNQIGPIVDREIDPLWISRQALEADNRILKPGCGWLPPDWLFHDGLRRALRSLARASDEDLSEYATPLGLPALRQFLARRLANAGIDVAPEGIMLTESGTQAIDLICRFFLEPGDTVLVDDPCYFNFQALLKAHRVTVIGVPFTPQGPDVDAFADALQHHSPRLYVTNSGIHNPTGATLSPVTAHRLLKVIDATDLVVVEDDIFADLEISPAHRLATFDGLNKVIQIGSFSKTISGALRCGYIAARGDWIESLVDLKIATTFGGGRMAADLVLKALTDSGYRKHMDSIRQRLAEARLATLDQLARLNIQPWLIPQAGMFLWCELPEGFSATEIARRCLKEGVVLAPGNAFSQTLTADRFLRFNVAQCQNKRVYKVLEEAMKG